MSFGDFLNVGGFIQRTGCRRIYPENRLSGPYYYKETNP
jgi:hypothetical protein